MCKLHHLSGDAAADADRRRGRDPWHAPIDSSAAARRKAKVQKTSSEPNITHPACHCQPPRPTQRRTVDFSPRRKDSQRFDINPTREAKLAADPQR